MNDDDGGPMTGVIDLNTLGMLLISERIGFLKPTVEFCGFIVHSLILRKPIEVSRGTKTSFKLLTKILSKKQTRHNRNQRPMYLHFFGNV